METKRITVERCESCGRHHRLRISYDPSCLPTPGLPPDAVLLPVEFVCPNSAKKTSVEVDFDAPIEFVNTVAE